MIARKLYLFCISQILVISVITYVLYLYDTFNSFNFNKTINIKEEISINITRTAIILASTTNISNTTNPQQINITIDYIDIFNKNVTKKYNTNKLNLMQIYIDSDIPRFIIIGPPKSSTTRLVEKISKWNDVSYPSEGEQHQLDYECIRVSFNEDEWEKWINDYKLNIIQLSNLLKYTNSFKLSNYTDFRRDTQPKTATKCFKHIYII